MMKVFYSFYWNGNGPLYRINRQMIHDLPPNVQKSRSLLGLTLSSACMGNHEATR